MEVLSLWKDITKHLPNTHYQLRIPFRYENNALPNSRNMAECRLLLSAKKTEQRHGTEVQVCCEHATNDEKGVCRASNRTQ